MEFTAVVAALLRRWYVVLVGSRHDRRPRVPGHDAVPPTYSATGSVLLLPPGASLADGSNPLLSLGGLEQPAALVVAYLAGDDARQAFAEDFPDTTYDIVLDPLSRGPLVLVTVEDPSTGRRDVGARTRSSPRCPSALAMLQDQVDAPADSRVTSMPLSVDTRAHHRAQRLAARAHRGGRRAALVLTLVGAIAFDALAARRRERRRAAAGAPTTAEEHRAPRPSPAEPVRGSRARDPAPTRPRSSSPSSVPTCPRSLRSRRRT